MTMGKARVSCSEGANDGDNENFDDVDPEEWTMLRKHVPPCFYLLEIGNIERRRVGGMN